MKSKKEKNKNGDSNIQVNKDDFQNNTFYIYNRENSVTDYNDRINLNILEYLWFRKKKKSQKYKFIELYRKAHLFYRKKMNISHVFILLSIIEDYIIS